MNVVISYSFKVDSAITNKEGCWLMCMKAAILEITKDAFHADSAQVHSSL